MINIASEKSKNLWKYDFSYLNNELLKYYKILGT